MKDIDFKALTKTQKLKMQQIHSFGETKCSKLLFLTTSKKMDGWGIGASYGFCEGRWKRFSDYDCFNFTFPTTGFLKGDFEYGGVTFFLGSDATVGYGNGIIINKPAR